MIKIPFLRVRKNSLLSLRSVVTYLLAKNEIWQKATSSFIHLYFFPSRLTFIFLSGRCGYDAHWPSKYDAQEEIPVLAKLLVSSQGTWMLQFCASCTTWADVSTLCFEVQYHVEACREAAASKACCCLCLV